VTQAKSDRTAAEKERDEAQAKIEENEKYIRIMQKRVHASCTHHRTRVCAHTHSGVIFVSFFFLIQINERKRQHVDEMTLMREKYEQLETQVQEYHHRLIKAMRG
jgi:hypothetical protein